MHLTIALKIRNADQLEVSYLLFMTVLLRAIISQAKFWSVSDPDNADYGISLLTKYLLILTNLFGRKVLVFGEIGRFDCPIGERY